MPVTPWRSAPSIWRAIRAGTIDENICGVSIHGRWFVSSAVLRDAAALAGIEGRSLDWISAGELARGADLVLHDAQYLQQEYEAKIGWGHSSVDDAVAFCRAVDAGRLVLFHHEPDRSDHALELLQERARELTGDERAPPLLAREGLSIDLS